MLNRDLWLRLSLLLLCFSLPVRAQLVITEFMAQNTRTVKDEDGDFSDWIEIQNQSTNPVSLLNWSLTDNAGSKTKWTFPSANLGPQEFLLVFASEKNRRLPGKPLHTNFKLSDGGEYLALVKPDGTTITSQYSPRFPAQLPDISFGYGMEVSTSSLIASNATSRWLVPTSVNGGEILGDSWRGATEPFDDFSWKSATGSLGYSRGLTNLVGASSLSLRYDFANAPDNEVIADVKPSGILRNGTNFGARWEESSIDGASPALRRTGVMVFSAETGSQVTIAANPDVNINKGSVVFWMRSAGNQGPGNDGAILFDRRTTRGDVIVLNNEGRLLVQAVSGPGTVRNTFMSNRAIADDRWHLVTYTYDQTAAGATSLYIDGVLDKSQANSGAWSWDTTSRIELGMSHDPYWRRFDGALDDFRFYKRILTPPEIAEIYSGDGVIPVRGIATDVGDAMHTVNGSLLVRFPFIVEQPDVLSLLSLALRYDDGFVAFINGQEVVRANALDPILWNSVATATHGPSREESFSFGNIKGLLHAGTNILAIHGLNLGAADDDLYLSVRLTGTELGRQTSQPQFFQRPTPGAPNGGGVKDLGPILAETQHSPRIPTDVQDLLVTTRVTPSFNPVQSVTLRYRVHYGATNSVPMLDDGLHGDGAAADGQFGAFIPASASTNGQLVRYFITAADSAGNTSRWPLFENPVESEEYLGTVVRDPSITTALPIYQLFVRTPAGMDTDAGTQGSFFYDGELYDNVFVRLKGGTTRGLNKKAHRVDFLKSRPFRFSETEKPVRELALNAEFIDPSYLRQNTSFWLFNQAGTPAPIHFAVRLHVNGQFHQLAFHTETMDDRLLERMGLNPEGALYKNALMLNILPEAAIGGRDCREAEKQTRLNEDLSDLVSWTTGIAENRSITQRREHLFDTTDIPSVINYLACFHLTQQADGVHANVCPHRDTGVTDEWRLVPWDMNLSMGQVWAVDHIAGNEDDRESHPFYGASGWRDSAIPWSYNRLFDSLIVVPELREMYLRRLRTLMDQLLQPPGTAESSLVMDNRIKEMWARIEPEALADRKKWGWAIGYGGYSMTNVPFNQAVEELLNNYVRQRRTHFYGTHNTANSSYANRAGIPDAQPLDIRLQFGRIETTPASGNSLEEFIELQNTNTFAVDITGWKVAGAIDFTFRPGTVIPAGGNLYLSPEAKAFRARQSGPRGGQGLMVQGPYQGRLSNLGEMLQLTDHCGRMVASAVVSGALSSAQQSLRVSELMYHPPEPSTGPYASEDFEYLELVNTSNTALNLAGVRFTEGIQFSFTTSPSPVLGPGERTVIVRNLAAFRSRYGNGPDVAGVYQGSLNNSGERLKLEDAAGEEVLDFSYEPSWHRVTDGLGFSLIAVNLLAGSETWATAAQWQPSERPLGQPGLTDTITSWPQVRISEVLANSSSPEADAIELFNPSDSIADVSYWFLTDDPAQPKKYRLPAGTTIPGRGFLVVREPQFNPNPGLFPSFALSAGGDEVGLYSANAAAELTGYSDVVRLPASAPNQSLGRWSAAATDRMIPLSSQSLGISNSPPKVALLVSEIHYHSIQGSPSDPQDEYVELYNATDSPLLLQNPQLPSHPWRLTGDIEYVLPTNTVIPPRSTAVIVGFDPENSPASLESFRTRWDVPATTFVLGPYSGSLDHGGGTLKLLFPISLQADDTTGQPTLLEQTLDEATFDDEDAWPTLADGQGASLHRRSMMPLSTESLDWNAAAPSPGRTGEPPLPPIITHPPISVTKALGSSVSFSVRATGSPPLRYQWRRNGEAIPGATGPDLNLESIQVTEVGCYDVVVMNSGGAILSDSANLWVQLPPIVTQSPASAVAAAGTNITLRAGAIGNGVLSLQWLRNGVPIPEATNATLVLRDVQVDQTGLYALRISDEAGSVVTDPARLIVAILPTIAIPPQPITVAAGGTAVFSVAVNGTGPFTYRWRRGATTISTLTVNSAQSFLVLTNVQPSGSANYSVLVGNVLGNARTIPSATLSVVVDTDGDGIPDDWESSYGLDPRVADGVLDPDADNLTNLQEYRAGSDPLDAESGFRIHLDIEAFQPLLEFSARSNRTYSVQYKEGLESTLWLKLGDIVSQPIHRVEKVADTNASPAGRFYRLITPAQP
ncbi:MAG: lamin tail domain-containing protein [Verrucomicrobiales bacterium]|nr:lamin tail domain-containing protein [Verrucomicrobiales bacterium]